MAPALLWPTELILTYRCMQGRPAMMPDFQKDYEAGRRLLSDNGLPVFEAPIHLEGGSIHSDGQGTMVVTEECLLDPSRNPELGREGIEQVRRKCLAAMGCLKALSESFHGIQ